MNQDNKPVHNTVDAKSIKPEVLGHLRTEKIGNPSMLIAIIAIIVIVLLLLPIGSSLLQNPKSPLYKFVYGSTDTVITEDDVKSEFDDGSLIQVLDSASNIKYGNLVLKNFSLSVGEINCDVYSYNGILDLDNDSIFMNIYSTNEESSLIGHIKIIGKDYDSTTQRVTFYNPKLKFNQTHTYYGKLITLKDDSDYPNYTVSSDESGIGSVTCKRNTREIEYVFENNYLIAINDTVTEKVKKYSSKNYLSLLQEYLDKAEILGYKYASVTEEEEGFTYLSKIDLRGYTYPDKFTDTNYYKENTLAKVIVYSQVGKGYDCE